MRKEKRKRIEATEEQKVMLEIRQSGNFDTFLRHRAFKFYNTMKQMQNDTEHLFQKDQHDEAEGRGL